MGKDGRRQRLKHADEGRVDELERKLKFHFRHRDRALTALTHSSFRHEMVKSPLEPIEDNERLEFLGDAVVDLAVGLRLMERHPNLAEGALSRMRSEIVDERGLARVARKLGLGPLLRLGFGEKKTGGADKPSVISDAMEAVLAAVFLEAGLDGVLAIVDREFGALFDEAFSGAADVDFKAMLQAWTQARWKTLPTYELVSAEGPSHAKMFCVRVLVEGAVRGEGKAHSKKEAARLAARAAIEAFERELGEEILARSPVKFSQSAVEDVGENESVEGAPPKSSLASFQQPVPSALAKCPSEKTSLKDQKKGILPRKKAEDLTGTLRRRERGRR